MKSFKTFAAVLIAGAGLLGATQAGAVATYTKSFQGVTFTFEGDNGTNTFTLRIQNALGTTDPDWKDAASMAALGFKDLGIDFSAAGVSASMTSAPSSAWDYLQGELDAAGCKDPKGQKGVICFSTAPPLAISDDMLFTVTITGATLNIGSIGPHVKLQFLDAAGVKEGSLFSENLTGGDGGLPEPNTLALLGLGLLGLGFGARRRLK